MAGVHVQLGGETNPCLAPAAAAAAGCGGKTKALNTFTTRPAAGGHARQWLAAQLDDSHWHSCNASGNQSLQGETLLTSCIFTMVSLGQ